MAVSSIFVNNNKTMKFLSILMLTLTLVKFLQAAPAETQVCDDKAVAYVKAKCMYFDEFLKNLDDFMRFEENYGKLVQCLRMKTPSAEATGAELTCVNKGILFPAVSSIGRLIRKFTNPQEPLCTYEFASQLYSLQSQLSFARSEHLSLILITLTNLVIDRCHESVGSRLLDVEQRAPDTIKHTSMILALLGMRESVISNLPLEAEDFVPVIEREMPTYGVNTDTSIGSSSSGLEFRVPISPVLDAARISCAAIATYHLNILGSLGLLVSSIAKNTRTNNVDINLPKLGDKGAQVKTRIRQWVLSAMICQSLKTVNKLSTVDVDGKMRLRIMILPIQEPDATYKDESDMTFSSFKLEEVNESIDLTKVALLGTSDSASKAMERSELNLRRKLQLITGPSYSLASSLMTYLDMTKPDRWKIPYAILGLDAPLTAPQGVDDDD